MALCRLLVARPDLLLLDGPTNHLDALSVRWLEAHLAAYRGTVLAVTHDRGFLDGVAQWILELDRGRAWRSDGNYTDYLRRRIQRMAVRGRKDAKRRRLLVAELDWIQQDPQARWAAGLSRLRSYEVRAADAERSLNVSADEIAIPPGPRLGSLVVQAEHLRKGFDGRLLVDDLSFSLPRGGIVAVLGPNGVGKTTLFRMIAGLEPVDGGKLRVGGSVRISYVDQLRSGIDPHRTLREVVGDGQDWIRVGPAEMPTGAYLATFGFRGQDQRSPAGLASGGQRGRLNLALTLASGGNLLLLDEPTNDLDLPTLGSLENALLAFPGCAMIASHDRRLLDRVATHVLAWEGDTRHEGAWTWFEGSVADYLECRPDVASAAVLHRRLTRR